MHSTIELILTLFWLAFILSTAIVLACFTVAVAETFDNPVCRVIRGILG